MIIVITHFLLWKWPSSNYWY